MTKAEHRHAADHQRYRHHQQVKYQQATAGAGEERGVMAWVWAPLRFGALTALFPQGEGKGKCDGD